MNYLDFFGFHDQPFRLTPDRDFFYASRKHSSLAETIKFGINQGDGFIIALGEVGTGKTMLIRQLIGELGAQFKTAFLVSPQLTPRELLLAILSDLGLPEKIITRLSLHGLLQALNRCLVKLAETGRKLLIIIDEAQDLPDESIEQLRLLSNFETDKHKWLQIILVGQPELKEKLARKHLRQLLQRVTVMETLYPLSKKEMLLYVHYRLARAGRGDFRLDSRAGQNLWRFTGGVPRLVNKLMGRALLVAYARQQEINSSVIREAAASLHLKKPLFPFLLPW
ncbi:MAG: AAA family ATPase [Desulfobulbales bacterium]|nr:AAA family ATPase [Desulfobulbales bacterium]